jgi:hypothetical protein
MKERVLFADVSGPVAAGWSTGFAEEMRLGKVKEPVEKRLGARRVRVLGLIALLLVTGCRGGRTGRDVMHEVFASLRRSSPAVRTPEQLTAAGTAAINTACAEESFANARKGLIVDETKLHEDVFELRDPESFAAIPYGLNETLRLEESLRAETKAAGQTEKEAGCLESFAAHLQTLTDPLVEADRIQKELDVSAFENSAKQADEQLEKKPAELNDAPVKQP